MNIVITGGASGLGRSISERLLNNPTHRFLISYRTDSELISVWRHQYPQITFVQCDFSVEGSINDLLKAIDDFLPEVLINNANLGYKEEHFHKTNDEFILNGFSCNVLATLKITRKCILIFRKKKTGRIINILSSVLAGNPPVGWSLYTAEKAYLLSMSKSWAIENAAFKITSNSISPEFMQTGMTSAIDERIVEQIIINHPLKRLLTIGEVAEVADFFIHCPLHVNGSNFIINAARNVI